ncbi:hypothetical protein ACFX2A_032068 [Malus domestica]
MICYVVCVILVFPSAKRGSLESNLYGSIGEHFEINISIWTEIAIEIARGVRYMHENVLKARRPLLMRRAFHELDEVWEDVHMHELSAFQCTKTSPESQSCMSKILSYLKGKSFKVMQSSPPSSYNIP